MWPELPTGTITFLFTDVEGSTRLLHDFGDGYAEVLAEHRRVLRECFGRHGGIEVDTQGTRSSSPSPKPRMRSPRLPMGGPHSSLARSACEWACIQGSALVGMRRERDAARLWGAAEAQERELGFRMLLAERQRYERWMSVGHERLVKAFDGAYAAGARLTLKEAATEALAHVRAAREHSARPAP